jgi:hypothetical protein
MINSEYKMPKPPLAYPRLQHTAPYLRSLLPLAIQPEQRTRRTRQPDQPIIEVCPSQSRTRNCDIAQVADELDADGSGFLVNLLLLDDALAVLVADGGLALAQLVERVQRGDDRERDAGEPGAVAFTEEALGGGEFLDVDRVELRVGVISLRSVAFIDRPDGVNGIDAGSNETCTYHRNIIQQHIRRIPQLPANLGIPQHGIHTLRIARNRRSPEMLHELAHAQQLARGTELLLRRLERRNRRLRPVRPVQVPC